MLTPLSVTEVHGTAVALEGPGGQVRGILLRGPSGSGKSDLALRLIEQGWRLVADDRTRLAAEGGRLMAWAPAALSGLLEVRGVGILSFPALSRAPVLLVADLVGRAAEPRLPEAAVAGDLPLPVRRLALWPFAASAALKLRLALGEMREAGPRLVVGG